MADHVFQKNLVIIRRVKYFEKILVVPDIHIGDAIMIQAGVSAFRDFFPHAQIDYVVKKSVACLIEGNPDITNLFPVFTGSVFPNPEDLEKLKKLVVENHYDLCYNCSPFFEDTQHFPKGQPILNFMTVAPQIMRNEMDHKGKSHSVFLCHELPHLLLSPTHSLRRDEIFKGVSMTLSDGAIGEARDFLRENRVPEKTPLVFLNPDTASPFTRIPFEDQVDLLKRLVREPGHILLGTDFTTRNLEERLLEKLSPGERYHVTRVPTTLSLAGYAALIDFADVFISGDTGPLHMAAARKVSRSGNFKFRNRTFVASVFGATPARLTGYDSQNPLFQSANQDVPSKTYVSKSPCRNTTCVNKLYKTCRRVRCFEGLDVAAIAAEIQSHLSGISFKRSESPDAVSASLN